MNSEMVVWLEGEVDPAQVGTKVARLAALAGEGVRIPVGFAVTAAAYQEFVRSARLGPVIAREIRRYRAGRDLVVVAAAIRTAFREAPWPAAVADEILKAYEELGGDGTEVAVRCSPVGSQDDPPDEVFLRLRTGADVLAACRRCFAALFSAVAVGNREHWGLDHLKAAMPITVQPMVRADLGGSGTVRGESTFVRIRAARAGGDPDLYSVHPGARPMIVKHRAENGCGLVLSDDEIRELANWSVIADRHFKRPMELEWAKDGRSAELYLVEVRPWVLPAMTIGAPVRSDSARRVT